MPISVPGHADHRFRDDGVEWTPSRTATAPRTVKASLPTAVEVSIPSVVLTYAIPTALNASSAFNRC